MSTPMLGSDLYTMTTQLNGGVPLDNTLFYQLLTIAQTRIEAAREWMILRKQNTSQTVTAASTFQTPYAMPTDFFFWQSEQPLILVDTTNTNNFIDWFKEIPMAKLVRYQFQTYKFAVDYLNSNLYIAGTVDRTYTMYKNYVYKPADVTVSTSWVFPAQFHGLLAYAVTALNKGGIDFDDQNARMAGDNKETVQSIYQAMIDWDSRLQEQSLEGVDRGPSDDRPWVSGHVDLYD